MSKEITERGDESKPLVERSSVPNVANYKEYRKYLRYDFWYSCAYCRMSEAEAQAIRFTIDHYEPRRARPDLECLYSNLMYCCDECNSRKGDRIPPPSARSDGYKFFRVDEEIFSDHFERDGVRISAKSNTGMFTIEALDLNRLSLRRIRELRARIMESDELVAQGIAALKRFRIDRLPREIRGKAVSAIRNAESVLDIRTEAIDSLLRRFARSSLLDPDDEADSRAELRKENLKELEVLYPGKWRARGA